MNFPVVVAGGQTVSSAVSTDLSRHVIGLEIPTIDTASIYIQASNDGQTFRRVLRADGTGDWFVASTNGNRFVFLDQFAPFKFLMVELSARQSVDRVFNFVVKDR